ncbi:MAG: hypothetical protein RJA37_910 [Verrucomicrobiota bacterium]|jgi:CDP-glucose 4,6-dehydratase
MVNMFRGAFRGKKVWISGHTGFKGAWLAHWLLSLGAEVRGFAQPPAASQKLYCDLGLDARVDSQFGDVRDREAVHGAIRMFRPDFVFHLAAQSLVRRSYSAPVETFETNVMGTVNVLEALRIEGRPCAVVVVTSDKCYENDETGRPFAENDRLGGHDPYSASKGMAEIAASSYRKAFFAGLSPVALATARAGNVIGGGDLAEDRVVPDLVRARDLGQPICLRHPEAVRPWQHVVEPLSGYLWLAACLSGAARNSEGQHFRSAFNFGPPESSAVPVRDLVKEFQNHWPDLKCEQADSGAHEAKLLMLDTSKVRSVLGWRPVWGVARAVERTAAWHRFGPREACDRDLDMYFKDASKEGLPWTI